MSNETLAPHGPFKVDLVVYTTDEEGQMAKVTLTLSPGEMPTWERFKKAFEDAIAMLPEDGSFRLMDRYEFCNMLIEERTGVRERFAIPGENKWIEP